MKLKLLEWRGGGYLAPDQILRKIDHLSARDNFYTRCMKWIEECDFEQPPDKNEEEPKENDSGMLDSFWFHNSYSL